MKHVKSTERKKSQKKKPAPRVRTEVAGMPALPNPPLPSQGSTLPGSSEKNTDYHDADRELNLSPLGTPQAGFGEFYNDEWDEDQDVANDFLRARDDAALKGHHPTKKKDFLTDGDR